MNDETEPQVIQTRDERQLPAQRQDISQHHDGLSPLVQAAMNGELDPERLEKLLEIQKSYEANEARKEFNSAFADFKAEAVTILKGTLIKDGPLKGKRHADLFDVVSATTGPLAKHGLTISWKTTKDEPNWMEVTCTLKHDAGHSETESMGGLPDAGPGRNAIQARGSTRTYLQRYTAMAILGLAARDMDDDGRTAEPPKPVEKITQEQWADLNTMLVDTQGNVDKFCQLFGIEKLEDLPASEFGKAVNKIKTRAKKIAERQQGDQS